MLSSMPGQQRVQTLLWLLGCCNPHNNSWPPLSFWWDRRRAGCGAGDHRWGDLHWGGGGDLDKDQPHGSLDWTAKLGDWSVQQWWTTDVFLGSAFDQIIIWVNIFFLDQLNYGVRLLAENHFNHFTNLGTKFNWINIGRELRSLNWNVYSGWNCIKWQSVCHLPFFLSSIKPQMNIVDKPARLTIRVLLFLFLIVRRVPRPSESSKKCRNIAVPQTLSWLQQIWHKKRERNTCLPKFEERPGSEI